MTLSNTRFGINKTCSQFWPLLYTFMEVCSVCRRSYVECIKRHDDHWRVK